VTTAAQPSDKAVWRRLLLRGRRAVPTDVRAAEAGTLVDAARTACAAAGAHTVCAYVPAGAEPGSVAMLDGLRAAGIEVLLPVVPAGADGALGWGRYLGEESLVAGAYGLREPDGEDLGPTAIARAGLVLVPALAVDVRGVRLGRGAGWYDRSLPLARPGTPLVAVVRDDEVVEALPAEPHDVRMTGVLTPGAGLRLLPIAVE
jgi:5-formyltetrahydrofolate cyclo-ligase